MRKGKGFVPKRPMLAKKPLEIARATERRECSKDPDSGECASENIDLLPVRCPISSAFFVSTSLLLLTQ